MKSRSFVILLGLTVLSAAAAGAAAWQRQQAIEIPAAPKTLFPDLLDQVNSVAALSVVTPSTKFTIRKSADGAWQVTEKENYPVKFETVKQAVVGMAGLKPLAPKTAREKQFTKLAVDDPGKGGSGKLIALMDADDKPLSAIIIGLTKSSSTDTRLGWYYVRRPDQQRSWLVAGRLDAWDKVTKWLDDTMPVVDRPRIWSVASTTPDQKTVVVSRKTPLQNDFELENVPEGRKVAYSTAPNALGAAMGFINFDDVVARTKIKGWENSHTTVFRTFDGLVVTVKLVKASKTGTWSNFQFTYEPDMVTAKEITAEQKKKLKSAEEVKKQVGEFQQRYGKWAYKLPDYKTKDFLTDAMSITVADTKEKPSN